MSALAARRTRSSSVDVVELSHRWRDEGDERARAELFERFQPLARGLAARYRNPYEPFDDLTQVASIGLLHAIDRFDPDHGARFEGFAVPTILGELKRYFRDTGWTAHVPRRAKELSLLVDRASAELTAQAGRAPAVQTIADHLGASVEDVLVGLDAGMAHYSSSLDAPAPGSDSDEPQALADQVGAIDHAFNLIDTKLSLAAAVARLPHAERTALRLRMDHDIRQCEIAERMGCSQMQVSRLLRRAAERVRALIEPELELGRAVRP